MQVPGFLWTAVLALIPLLVQWLGGDYFDGQSWVPWAIMALGLVAKAIELAREQAAAERPSIRIVGEEPPAGFSLRRLLLG